MAGKGEYLSGGAAAVWDVRFVGIVYEFLISQKLCGLMQDAESADAGIENTDFRKNTSKVTVKPGGDSPLDTSYGVII